MDSRGRAILSAVLIVASLAFLAGSGCNGKQDAARVQEALEKFKNGTEDERRAAAVALAQIGPAADKALPDLYASLDGKGLVLFGQQDPFVEDVTSAIARIAKGKAVDHAYGLLRTCKSIIS